ncbi:HAD family phosphatase [Salinimonas sp. HHU 13199]|uniref:HAD family phosphatase n=1 Tax=Salinimonas profundi TaxID=2729140 RepID=A0ABR8LK96_9ALTE|nr:HAD family phosphatase [Salinimonas profundi]MBD3585998.1 HAD family phosphatase [Salinimonas profundi]
MPEQSVITPSTTLILFDHDGTLVDSEAVHFSLWKSLLDNYGIALSESLHNEMLVGMPVAQNAIDVTRHFSLSAKPEDIAAQKHQLTRDYLKNRAFPLIEDARQAIIRCHQAGYQLGIVTGGSQLSVEQTMQHHHLRKYISLTVSVEDVEHSKPHPESYHKALAIAGLSAGQAAAVEDTMHGMKAAVAAGIRCAVIPTAQSAAHDFSAAQASYPSLTKWLDNELAT